MRVLAVTSPKRLIAAPELPTATELGLVGMNVIGSIGLLAPAGTPVEFIEQIAQATRTAMAEPAYQRLLIDAGIEPVLDSNPEKLRRTLAADVALWAALEFPDGHIVLLTQLCEGQEATVLQLPARPTTAVEADAQKRIVNIG
jgi:hypothetical protein